ncbi:MAG: hypothetical protein RL148_298 [Planctomycetota bacterium]
MNPKPFPMLRAALAALVLAALAPAQRALSHDDYDGWKSLRATTLSLDGKWVAYQVEPQWGDGVLEVRSTQSDTVWRHPLGEGVRFSADGRYAVFMVARSKVEQRNKQLEELKKKAKEKKEGGAAAAAEAKEETPAQAPAEPAVQRPEGGRRGGAGGRGGRAGGGRPGAAPAGSPAPAAPAEDTTRSMAVLDLATGKVELVERVKGFTLGEESNLLVYHLEKPAPKKEEPKKEETPKQEEAAKQEGAPAAEPAKEPAKEPAPAETKPAAEAPVAAGGEAKPAQPARKEPPKVDPLEKKRKEGTVLVLRDLTGARPEQRIEDVVGHGTTRKEQWIWYHTSAKKPKEGQTHGLFAVPGAGGDAVVVLAGFADYGSITSDRSGKVLAFTSTKEDFAAEKPKSDLYVWRGTAEPAQRVLHEGTQGFPQGRLLGTSASFTRDGQKLTVSFGLPPEDEVPQVLADEKVVLDVWHWDDPLIQTAQAKNPSALRRGSWSAVLDLADGSLRVLGDDAVESFRLLGPDGAYAVGSDGDAYRKLSTWDGRYEDVYLTEVKSGVRTRVLERLRGNVSNSPGGRYLLWFGEDRNWWTLDTASRQVRNLTASIGIDFHQSDDDTPQPDPAQGVCGWTSGDQHVVLYDEFDLWRVEVATGKAECLTAGAGRAKKVRYRHSPLPRDDDEDDGSLPAELLLGALDTETMAEGYAIASRDAVGAPVQVVMVQRNIGELRKAKQADLYAFTLSTFSTCPDLWVCSRDMKDLRRLTDVNPQQKDIRWGKAELVHWVNGDGKRLKGVLVKPDGFDPARKYPMMVYFYEKLSQNLHNYVAPAPGTSPNAAYYVSNGYLWFMPDIVYDEGYPGESAVKCVVSGVQHLIAQGFVDEKAIGAAGHSWGGYQTAFLVTRTNIFKAVESGAPVCNMLSAYGGIRYETGISRQFQYEMTQSRIGGTPWQFPLRYHENSPIHFADKVQTPVLILHNDQDGAVPWTQGIEYFMALRRLDKETYLFNYVGEGHGLRKRQNMKDWSRRMSEYFDHHLRGAQRPQWMEQGVPFHERDREKLATTPSYHEVRKAVEEAKPAEKPAESPAGEAPAAGEPAAKPESSGGAK